MSIAEHTPIARNRPPITARFGMAVIAAYILIAIFAPLIAPYGERDIVGDQYMPWTAAHLLGTDSLGRDMLSRMIFAARNTLAIAVAVTTISFVVGVVAGLVAAALGGVADFALSRLVDVIMAIPSMIATLLLLTIFGTGLASLVLVVAMLDSTRVFRLSRALSQNIVVTDYVETARLRGEGLGWIVFREILPNVAPPLIAEFGMRFSFVFLTIAALSFLGVGIQPPSADWGGMVRENAALVTYGDPTPLLPAGAIALLTIAVNLVVDWIVDHASGMKE